jgi:hypothetical protein
MVTLLLGLNFGGGVFAWSSPLVICLLVSGMLMAAVFILCEKKARFPLVPLDILGKMSNVGVLIIGFTHDWVSASFHTLWYQIELSAHISKRCRRYSLLSFISRCTFKPFKAHRLLNLAIASYQSL